MSEIRHMNKREIIEQTIRDQLGVSQKRAIDDEDNLFDDYGADSLDHVELVMIFEEILETEIPDADAEKWQTVGDVMKYFGVDQ